MSARDEYPMRNGLSLSRERGEMWAEIDRLRSQIAEWEAIRQTVNCPTCNGRRYTERLSGHGDRTAFNLDSCPDCTDGKIPMARLIAVGAAVFNARSSGIDCVESSIHSGQWHYSAVALVDDLRAVKP